MGKNGRKSCRRWLLPAALVLAGAAWFENFTLSSSTVEVRSAALPAAFSGLRVVQISDLHGRRFDAGSRYLLALVRLQSPDIIALTGDLADEFTDVSMLPPLLEGLTALAPTFYVTGNHEWVLSREKRQALFDLLDFQISPYPAGLQKSIEVGRSTSGKCAFITGPVEAPAIPREAMIELQAKDALGFVPRLRGSNRKGV